MGAVLVLVAFIIYYVVVGHGATPKSTSRGRGAGGGRVGSGGGGGGRGGGSGGGGWVGRSSISK